MTEPLVRLLLMNRIKHNNVRAIIILVDIRQLKCIVLMFSVIQTKEFRR